MTDLSLLPTTQEQLVKRLKSRGPQSIKILAGQLGLTTMGVRQHLAQLQEKGYVKHAQLSHQTRGRPVTLWKLTTQGHALFTDGHARIAVELITAAAQTFGEAGLNKLVEVNENSLLTQYQNELPDPKLSLSDTLEALCAKRSREGFMAELRLTPSGWLLIENHCPIFAAARSCSALCVAELSLFKKLLEGHAIVERSDHLLEGARRCAYRIQPIDA